MQIPDPKFDIGQEVSTHSGYRFKVGLRTYYEATGWHYQEKASYTAYTERELILKVDCPFPTGSRVCHLLDPNKIYLVDGTLLKFGTTTTQVSDWSRYVLAPKFKMGDKLRHPVHGVFTVNRVYWFHSPTEKGVWAYNDNFEYNCTKVTSPFEPGTRVAYIKNPAHRGTVQENYNLLVDSDSPIEPGTTFQSNSVVWDVWSLEPKFKIGDKLWHNVHGTLTVQRISWFESPNEKGTWSYNDNFERNLEYAKNIGPFKPGDRVACKSYPAKVGKVAENYDILIDLDAPKNVAGQVIPSHIVVWSAWAPAPKYKLPLAIKHRHYPDNVGYADSVAWCEDRWEYRGPVISGTFEENVIELNAEISKLRIATALNMEEGNQKIIELFLGEYEND